MRNQTKRRGIAHHEGVPLVVRSELVAGSTEQLNVVLELELIDEDAVAACSSMKSAIAISL
jgi:hypothetical protein